MFGILMSALIEHFRPLAKQGEGKTWVFLEVSVEGLNIEAVETGSRMKYLYF